MVFFLKKKRTIFKKTYYLNILFQSRKMSPQFQEVFSKYDHSYIFFASLLLFILRVTSEFDLGVIFFMLCLKIPSFQMCLLVCIFCPKQLFAKLELL